MKFEDDDLKDGKLWAALQKEIDRDLAEKESGETFQEELADIEDSIEFESKETKSEDRIPDETANLSNLRSVLEATERAKDEEAKQKMKQTKVEPVTQDIEIPEFTEEEEEIEETPAETPKKVSRVSRTTEKLEGLVDFDDDPAETKAESEPEEVMVDDDLIGTGIVAVVYIATIMVMWAVDSDVYSPYKIYSQYTSVDLAVEKLGVMESFVVDVRASLTSGSDKGQISFASAGMDSVVDPLEGGKTSENIPDASDTKEPNTYKNVGEDTDTSGDKSVSTTEATTEVPVDTSPNVLDLDFEAINELSGSDAVASLSEYFENVTPTKKNEYTGMFEGYNVIWITAEGFTGYALESGLFPTLSKLADEGFVFDSYYQPLWYGSTLGGEYANLMGSPTKNGAYLSMCRAADNENGMYFSLANTLKRMGYSCYGFHDNDYTYYDRNITHPALGYEWIASGNGLEYQTDEYGQDIWPQSDLVMMEETFDKYTNDQPFHLYYLTVSGHVPYGYGAANAMSEKNKDVVSDLNYSDTTKAYLASQYEMEKMLEGIVERLEKRNLLDKTVIVLAGDHVPYDNMEVVDELAGQEFGYSLDAYRSRLVIWSGSMEKPVRVNKVCSSIDILPTLLNLMGAEYDSRLIIGRDILSDSAGLVLFPDRSYVTDTYEYNAALGTIVGDVSDETFDAMQLYVADKFTAADNITETGYYSYVAEYLGK